MYDRKNSYVIKKIFAVYLKKHLRRLLDDKVCK